MCNTATRELSIVRYGEVKKETFCSSSSLSLKAFSKYVPNALPLSVASCKPNCVKLGSSNDFPVTSSVHAPGRLASALAASVVARPRRYASLRRVERTRITSVHFLARFRLSLSLISRGWTPTGDWRRRTRRRRARVSFRRRGRRRVVVNVQDPRFVLEHVSNGNKHRFFFFFFFFFRRVGICVIIRTLTLRRRRRRVPEFPSGALLDAKTAASSSSKPIASPKTIYIRAPRRLSNPTVVLASSNRSTKPRAPKPSQNSSSRAPRRSSSSTSSSFLFQSHHITTDFPLLLL